MVCPPNDPGNLSAHSVANGSGVGSETKSRQLGDSEHYYEKVDTKNQTYKDLDEHESLRAAGFVLIPFRIEVVIDCPSSFGGRKCFEWTRCPSSITWSPARYINTNVLVASILCLSRAISPFYSELCTSSYPQICRKMPITLALFGTHCAGKRTVGKLVAEKLGFGWSFQAELGEILRSDISLVEQANQHREGYIGSADDAGDSWDEMIHNEECKRDAQTVGSRVVETWHIGEEI